MNSFSRVVKTRLLNQPVSLKVCGRIFDCDTIKLTELFAVGEDKGGKAVLIPVHNMLNLPAIYDAIVSLLNEWPNGLIFKTKEQTK